MKVSEYIGIVRANKPLQRLMIAGGGCKLALSIATNMTVLIMLYSCMMGNYDNLYLPMMVVGYIFSVPFFALTVRTSQKHGQKKSLMTYVAVAFLCYIGVLVMLMLWKFGDPAWNLSVFEGKLFGEGFKSAQCDMNITMGSVTTDFTPLLEKYEIAVKAKGKLVVDEVPYIDSYKYPPKDAIQDTAPEDSESEEASAYLKITGDDLSVSLDTPEPNGTGEETTAIQ